MGDHSATIMTLKQVMNEITTKFALYIYIYIKSRSYIKHKSKKYGRVMRNGNGLKG
jgi:hypothetical protein